MSVCPAPTICSASSAPFWLNASYCREGSWSEGRNWLEKLLARVPCHTENVLLAKAIHGLSVLVWVQGERQLAERLAREAVTLARRSGDDAMLATALRLAAEKQRAALGQLSYPPRVPLTMTQLVYYEPLSVRRSLRMHGVLVVR